MPSQMRLEFESPDTPTVNDAAGFAIVHGQGRSTIDSLIGTDQSNAFGIGQRFAAARFFYKGASELEGQAGLPPEFYKSMNSSEIVGFFVGAAAIRDMPDKIFPDESEFRSFLKVAAKAEERIEILVSALVHSGYGFSAVRHAIGTGFSAHSTGYGDMQDRIAGLNARDELARILRHYLNAQYLEDIRRFNLSGRARPPKQIPQDYAEGYLNRAAEIMGVAYKESERRTKLERWGDIRVALMEGRDLPVALFR